MYALILVAALGATPDYTLCANDYQITPTRKATAAVVRRVIATDCSGGFCRPVTVVEKAKTKSVVTSKPAVARQSGTTRTVRTFRRWFRG